MKWKILLVVSIIAFVAWFVYANALHDTSMATTCNKYFFDDFFDDKTKKCEYYSLPKISCYCAGEFFYLDNEMIAERNKEIRAGLRTITNPPKINWSMLEEIIVKE